MTGRVPGRFPAGHASFPQAPFSAPPTDPRVVRLESQLPAALASPAAKAFASIVPCSHTGVATSNVTVATRESPGICTVAVTAFGSQVPLVGSPGPGMSAEYRSSEWIHDPGATDTTAGDVEKFVTCVGSGLPDASRSTIAGNPDTVHVLDDVFWNAMSDDV